MDTQTKTLTQFMKAAALLVPLAYGALILPNPSQGNNTDKKIPEQTPPLIERALPSDYKRLINQGDSLFGGYHFVAYKSTDGGIKVARYSNTNKLENTVSLPVPQDINLERIMILTPYRNGDYELTYEANNGDVVIQTFNKDGLKYGMAINLIMPH